MELRETAVKANIERVVNAITKAAKKGAFSVNLRKCEGFDALENPPITLNEEMHEAIQAAFTSKLTFDGDVVSW
ncbi:MAG: hypothetical protein FWF94_08100 [Oscillospiraceae bacterium]|nr:hypothetical protein [Oscillospiraceae bacterium]